MKSIRVMSVPFKIKEDVITTYNSVSDVIGRNEKYLLAIILSTYRIRNRNKYLSKIRHALINRVERRIVIAVVDFFIELYNVNRRKSKFIASRIMRCVLDKLTM